MEPFKKKLEASTHFDHKIVDDITVVSMFYKVQHVLLKHETISALRDKASEASTH